MKQGRPGAKLKRFRELDGADKRLFCRAVVALAVARIMLVVTPFERLAARLASDAKHGSTAPDEKLLERVGTAVASAANNVPWRSDCFPQAIAAFMLMKHFGHDATIHLGVEKPGDELLGHAWVTCEGTVVVGGSDVDRYTEVHRIP